MIRGVRSPLIITGRKCDLPIHFHMQGLHIAMTSAKAMSSLSSGLDFEHTVSRGV